MCRLIGLHFGISLLVYDSIDLDLSFQNWLRLMTIDRGRIRLSYNLKKLSTNLALEKLSTTGKLQYSKPTRYELQVHKDIISLRKVIISRVYLLSTSLCSVVWIIAVSHNMESQAKKSSRPYTQWNHWLVDIRIMVYIMIQRCPCMFIGPNSDKIHQSNLYQTPIAKLHSDYSCKLQGTKLDGEDESNQRNGTGCNKRANLLY